MATQFMKTLALQSMENLKKATAIVYGQNCRAMGHLDIIEQRIQNEPTEDSVSTDYILGRKQVGK